MSLKETAGKPGKRSSDRLRDKRLPAEPLPAACSSLISEGRRQQLGAGSSAAAKKGSELKGHKQDFQESRTAEGVGAGGFIGFLSGERRQDRPVRLGLRQRLKNHSRKKGRAGDSCHLGFPSLNTYKLVDIVASSGFRSFWCFPVYPECPPPFLL